MSFSYCKQGDLHFFTWSMDGCRIAGGWGGGSPIYKQKHPHNCTTFPYFEHGDDMKKKALSMDGLKRKGAGEKGGNPTPFAKEVIPTP